MNSSLRIADHVTTLKLVLISLIVAIAIAAVAINAHLTEPSLRTALLASKQFNAETALPNVNRFRRISKTESNAVA
jgi:hypothetical protein